jgi:hypothetical protein
MAASRTVEGPVIVLGGTWYVQASVVSTYSHGPLGSVNNSDFEHTLREDVRGRAMADCREFVKCGTGVLGIG